jgi:hypothetical protein
MVVCGESVTGGLKQGRGIPGKDVYEVSGEIVSSLASSGVPFYRLGEEARVDGRGGHGTAYAG